MRLLIRVFPQIYTVQFYKTLLKVLIVVLYAVILSVIFGIFTDKHNAGRQRLPDRFSNGPDIQGQNIGSGSDAATSVMTTQEKMLTLDRALLSTDLSNPEEVINAGKSVLKELKGADKIDTAKFE